ncbi:hypothetical protein BpHYR1_050149 [Brachionus plicatilis]|uniref:Uncharacterized protein n=1 Tax=Brachionus plicatilis TaxID=10195 RepID=A0A3M7QXQ8_BRAPC|nr:hypothetical protein BpHYR1_050149 [Brachionus plicatilis]
MSKSSKSPPGITVDLLACFGTSSSSSASPLELDFGGRTRLMPTFPSTKALGGLWYTEARDEM